MNPRILKGMNPSRTRRRRAFTLIELIVVIAVLLLLMAIALPSFMGVRDRGADTAVQSAITNSYHGAKAIWASEGQYPALAGPGGLLEQLQANEPGYDYVETDPTVPATQLKVTWEDDQTITFCGLSGSGLYYCLRANEQGLLEVASSDQAPGPAFQAAATVSIVRSRASTLGDAECLLPTVDEPAICAPNATRAADWSRSSLAPVGDPDDEQGPGGDPEPDTSRVYSAPTVLSGVAFGDAVTNGPAATASFMNPAMVELDEAGNLYVAEPTRRIVRKVAPDGSVTLFAGRDNAAPAVTDGTGVAGRFASIQDISWSDGTLWVADMGSFGNTSLRAVDAASTITTIGGVLPFAGDGLLRVGSDTYFGDNFTPEVGIQRVNAAGVATFLAATPANTYATRFAVAPDGTIAFANGSQIQTISPEGVITLIAGQPGTTQGAYQDGTALDGSGPGSAVFTLIQGIAYDSNGDLVVTDKDFYSARSRIRVISDNQVTTIAGYETSEAPGRFYNIRDLDVAPNGDIYFADAGGPNQVFVMRASS